MVAVGHSDLEIFPLALGGNTFGWTADETTSFDILDSFAEGGGNMIDTADSYSAFAPGNSGGESETIIGRWLAHNGLREHVVVATKVSRHPQFRGLAPETIAAASAASLERLQTDRIDLYYAHYDDPDVPLEDSLAAFDELVRNGSVRYLGISNYSPERVREWMSIADARGYARPVALQVQYNLVHHATFERDYAPLAAEFGLAVFPYYSLAAGFLAGKYRTMEDLRGVPREATAAKYLTPAGLEVVDALHEIGAAHDVEPATIALAWLLTRPRITAPLASASRLDQLYSLMDAPSIVLTSSEIHRLDTLSRAVAQ
ncbi:aldo/keto reductase [Rhodococcus rhodnii]|uniref:Aldo/keto reductase n=1 Tax=Rhodococcus rhodnii TaxID=38312 RepID=A0A6P2CIX8_9NOCA|nr:aldo/keto reductase [Rhodococcus rhodnii]TXG91711.1 aldo/keto reductase [Rhodococcus rhodnii]